MTETPTLIERVQALPSEIFNEIFDLTFTPESVTYVNRDYKPPAALQVNRATRERFLKLYFGPDRIFYVTRPILPLWLQSITVHTYLRWCPHARTHLGPGIQCEVRVTKLTFRTNHHSTTQLRDSLEREWYRIIGVEGSSRTTKTTQLSQRAGGVPRKRDEDGQIVRADSVINCLNFQVEYGELTKRGWVTIFDIDAALREPGIWRMTATEWCERKFGGS